MLALRIGRPCKPEWPLVCPGSSTWFARDGHAHSERIRLDPVPGCPTDSNSFFYSTEAPAIGTPFFGALYMGVGRFPAFQWSGLIGGKLGGR